MKLCRVREIRELDRKAIQAYHLPAEILMENAGNAVYQVIRQEADISGKSFVVLCGPGNNGGDGFVVARLLQANGARVKVFIIAEKDKYRNEAKKNLEILTRFPVEIESTQSLTKIRNSMKSADYIIDALLGTGVDRTVDGALKQVIELVNRSGKKVFAIDIASGINGDNGQEMGVSVKADYTVTFGLPKSGNLLYPGYGRGGKLFVSHISFPTTLTNSPDLKIEIPPFITLPARQTDTNKMDYGPVLAIAGAVNYYWAPHASAYSFLKAGGGYVYLACPASIIKSVARRGREIVFQPQIETKTGSLAYRNKQGLLELAQGMKMVILGPGLSKNAETQKLVRELVSAIEKPLLIDADGINALAMQPEILSRRRAPTILTPHIGEMCRLTGKTSREIEDNRVDILQMTAARLKSIIVLKSPHSLIGYPDGRVYVNLSGKTGGQAGMATAGAGDVLNGTIAAMYCLGLNVESAVQAGVFIHGLAGDLSAKAQGADGMTATDILEALPAAVKYYRGNLTQLTANFYDTVYEI